MSKTYQSIFIATMWGDASSFSNPDSQRWFYTSDAAYDWINDNHDSGCKYHVAEIECGEIEDEEKVEYGRF